jgi:hypothetical protein
MDTSSLKKHFKRAVRDSNWQRAAEIANKLGDLLKRQGNHKGKGIFLLIVNTESEERIYIVSVLFPNLLGTALWNRNRRNRNFLTSGTGIEHAKKSNRNRIPNRNKMESLKFSQT